MAEMNRPKESAKTNTSQGDGWRSDPDTVERSADEAPAENYPDDDSDNAGGISNRPLDEEVDNQTSLPPRATR